MYVKLQHLTIAYTWQKISLYAGYLSHDRP